MKAVTETDEPTPTPDRPGFAFDQWYRDSHDRVVRTLVAVVGNVDLASEATAEAFARALAREQQVEAMRNRDGWLFRTALNVARRVERRRALETRLLRRRRMEFEPPYEMADQRVWTALASLPDRQRQAIALRYVAELSEREVADAMGIAEGTASATLSFARDRLAKLLEEPQPEDGS